MIQDEVHPRQNAVISLRQPMVWCGIPLYFINSFTDAHFNLPFAEFVLIGLIFFMVIIAGGMVKSTSGAFAVFVTMVMILWIAIMDNYHGRSVGESLRVFLRNALFYSICLGYLLLPRKNAPLQLMAGFLLGYIVNFVINIPLIVFLKGMNHMYELKYILPTPAIVLLILFNRNLISRSIKIILLGYLGCTIIFMPLIGSRGAFISLFIGMGFYILCKFDFIKRWVVILLALFLPLLPVTLGSIWYEKGNPYAMTDNLFLMNYATLSNLERTLMLHFNIGILHDYPLTGIGYSNDIKLMKPYYLSLSKQEDTAAESPHNYYMEIAVPYGIPPLILAIVIWALIYRNCFIAAKDRQHFRGYAAFCCGVIGWIMLYQPVAGITRMDVFLLIFLGLYGLGEHKKSTENLHFQTYNKTH